MTRVAFVASALGAGGAERVIAQISKAVADAGRDVTVITFDSPEDPIYHAFDSRVKLVRLALPAGGLTQTMRRIGALRRTLRGGGFDAIISFLTKINVLTLLAARSTGTPVIVSERNNPFRQKAHRGWRIALARLYPRAAEIVLMSERMRRVVPAGARDRVTIIPNPVELPARPVDGAGTRFVAVGRLTEQKGFDLLIEAFARAAPHLPHWTLTIHGDGPERDSLEQQRRNSGSEHRIDLPGTTRTPLSWQCDASVFVLSSRYEGWPNALAEALAAGLPVVAVDCEFGASDLVRNGESGLLVPEHDATALSDAMIRLAHDPALRERLGRNARRAMARYSAAAIGDEWVRLLERHRA